MTTRQKNYILKDDNVTNISKILLEPSLLLFKTSLLSSKNKVLAKNILRVSKFAIVKLKDRSQNLLNKI